MLRIDENGNVFINGKNVNEMAKEAKPEIKTRTRRRIVRNGKVIQDEFVDSNNSGFPEELFDQFHSTSTNHTVVIRNGQVIQNDIVTDNENFNEEEFKKEFLEHIGDISLAGMDFDEMAGKESDIIVEDNNFETNASPVFESTNKKEESNENPKLIRCDFCGEFYKRRKKKCPHCGAKDGVI